MAEVFSLEANEKDGKSLGWACNAFKGTAFMTVAPNFPLLSKGKKNCASLNCFVNILSMITEPGLFV